MTSRNDLVSKLLALAFFCVACGDASFSPLNTNETPLRLPDTTDRSATQSETVFERSPVAPEELNYRMMQTGGPRVTPFMAGHIGVGLYYVGLQDQHERDVARLSVEIGLNWHVQNSANARLSFSYHEESLDEASDPAPDHDWIRENLGADMSLILYVEAGNGRANVPFNGASFGTIYYDGYWGFFDDQQRIEYLSRVTAHEVAHMFEATDQYRRRPTLRYGYLQMINGNAVINDLRGLFGGAGENQPDLMHNQWAIGPFTAGQVGWLDSDHDGIIDVLDTYSLAQIDGIEPSLSLHGGSTGIFEIRGTAQDQPRPRHNYGPQPVTINRVRAIQYRIISAGGTSPWVTHDQRYDEAAIAFAIPTPPLVDGEYQFEVRALNSVGNVQLNPAQQPLIVVGSPVSNGPPLASITPSPDYGSVQTRFAFAAGDGWDPDGDSNALTYQWDFDSDSEWDAIGPVVEWQFLSAGVHRVLVRVTDQAGRTWDESVEVSVTDQPSSPVATFSVDRTASHGDRFFARFVFDPTGSWDPDTEAGDLLGRWDFDGDQIWDTPQGPLEALSHTYSVDQYSKRWLVTLEVSDGSDVSSRSMVYTRAVEAFPYNHAPRIESVESAQNEPRLTAVVTHDDQEASWDGYLAHRWDFEGDGVPDTPFSLANSVLLPDSRYISTATLEVRDPFNAFDHWPPLGQRSPNQEIAAGLADDVADYVRVAPHVLLSGALGPDGEMVSQLWEQELLPGCSPFESGEECSQAPNAFATIGASTFVDWIEVELRDSEDPTIVVARRGTFVFTDGTVRDDPRAQSVFFPETPPGNYYVALQHRNHLGVMTSEPVALGTDALSIDFTDPTIPTYGSNAQRELGAYSALWAGDANDDGRVDYAGPDSDAAEVYDAVADSQAGSITLSVVDVYSDSDLNLSGTITMSGAGNDRALIFNNVFAHPAGNGFIEEQIPE